MRQQGHWKKKTDSSQRFPPIFAKDGHYCMWFLGSLRLSPPLELSASIAMRTWCLWTNHMASESSRTWNMKTLAWGQSCLEQTSGKKTHMLIGYLHLLTSILNITTRKISIWRLGIMLVKLCACLNRTTHLPLWRISIFLKSRSGF